MQSRSLKIWDRKDQTNEPCPPPILVSAGAAVAVPAVSRVAWAQSYPGHPVRLVVGFAAGSSADIVARVMGQWLSDRLGQQFVVENRPGAGTNIATEVVVR